MFVMLKWDKFGEELWESRRGQTFFKEMNHIICFNLFPQLSWNKLMNLIFNFDHELFLSLTINDFILGNRNFNIILTLAPFDL